MKLYKIGWEIDIYADTPEEAASKANDMLNSDTKWVFTITNEETDETFIVDMDEQTPTANKIN